MATVLAGNNLLSFMRAAANVNETLASSLALHFDKFIRQ